MWYRYIPKWMRVWDRKRDCECVSIVYCRTKVVKTRRLILLSIDRSYNIRVRLSCAAANLRTHRKSEWRCRWRPNLIAGDDRNYHPQHNNIITRSGTYQYNMPIYIWAIIFIIAVYIRVQVLHTVYTHVIKYDPLLFAVTNAYSVIYLL